MMAGDDKKAKPEAAAKIEAAPKVKSAPDAAPSKTEGTTPKAEGTAPKTEGAAPKADGKESKTAAGDKSGEAPSSYSRGEGQKPVSRAYRENWEAIFGKKK